MRRIRPFIASTFLTFLALPVLVLLHDQRDVAPVVAWVVGCATVLVGVMTLAVALHEGR